MNPFRLLSVAPAARGIRALRPFLRPNYRPTLIIIALIAVATGVFEASLLGIVGSLAAALESNQGFSEIDLPLVGNTSWQAVLIGGWVAAIAVIGLRIATTYLLIRLSLDALVKLRSDVVEAFLATSALKQQSERSGELQDLLVNHAPRASLILVHTSGALVSIMMLLVLTVSAAVVNVRVFLAMAVVITGVLLLTIPVQRYSRRRGSELSEAIISYGSEVSEISDAATQVRLFDAASTISQRADGSSRHMATIIQRIQVVFLTNPTLYRTLVLALLLSALVGLVANGTTELASAGTGALLMIRALMESQTLHRLSLNISENIPFLDETRDRLASYQADQVVYGNQDLEPIQDILIDDLHFSYQEEEQPAVAAADLRIKRGERVGIVGPSGTGKSTFLSLLLGLLQPQSGTISFNGQSLGDYTAQSRAREIAVVTQVPLILHETAYENIRFFRDWVSDEDVKRAAEAAGVADEIEALPDGYETEIGERGARALSGGQRQRVCIARALAGNPSLLVLDEPTSSLDVSAEEVVSRTMTTLGEDCTVIVVSHRESALQACDRRIEMSNGAFTELPA